MIVCTRVRWFDPLVAALVALPLGGFLFGAVPCVVQGWGSFTQCLSSPGILGTVAAVVDMNVWATKPDLEMAGWVGAAFVLSLSALFLSRARLHGTADE